MAIRVQNMPMKSLGQDSIYSTPHLTTFWNPHGQQLSEALPKNSSLRGGSPSQCGQEAKRLDFILEDQSSPSTQSSSQSQRGVTAFGRTNSQDQCVSSESVQIESYGKHVDEQVKSSYLMSNLELSVHSHPQLHTLPSQAEVIQSSGHVPYGYSDPYFSLYSAYGPQAIIQPQMMGLAPGRVLLPTDLAQEGPIYVNAKQYNGIMRRRQKRAKLEAQNKLVKARKPYLHESRHQHALNRVRGSGGRFLSTKKNQSEPTPSTVPDSASVHSYRKHNRMQETGTERSNANRQDTSTASSLAATGYMHGEIIFQQQQSSRTPNVPPQMVVSVPGGGDFMRNGMPHGAPASR
ncbi:OLC1v1037820C1 [Oldenlandia corymbosa var. corymbosa]|uniref:Nuclear transcription factor Y subunit n=1 Tax=Oldenlandia corymbosa var. corymbosa TaxID=529605 RepID=A0AAV1CYX5_OLDCO|nr:OLC1v1037820C1 [Oldenlandia corymbosa var. corymbosa]